MPDLGNISKMKPSSDQCDESLYTVPIKTLAGEDDMLGFTLDQTFSIPISNVAGSCSDDGARVSETAMAVENIDYGVSKGRRSVLFLVGSPKMRECRFCQKMIYPGEEVFCSVRDCLGVFHSSCLRGKRSLSSKKFKCPQHACFLCKQMSFWRCIKCTLAAHDRCAAFPEGVIRLKDQPGRVICWRHSSDWRLEKKIETPATNIQDILCHLPLPYTEEEFKIDFTWKEQADSNLEPSSYMQIKRNIYLIKKKRSHVDHDSGCTSCTSNQCSEDCVCRVQCISCSKVCHCSETCTNRPFRKEKKISLVKTEFCGWGVEAAVPIKEGEFVIEYVGEGLGHERLRCDLWFTGSSSGNCFPETGVWDMHAFVVTCGSLVRRLETAFPKQGQVEGETRVGIFAAQSIDVGEPLTYDYRFVQFGSEVKCQCGAPNCQGYLGTKKKVGKVQVVPVWGLKRKRTPVLNCIYRTSPPQTF